MLNKILRGVEDLDSAHLNNIGPAYREMAKRRLIGDIKTAFATRPMNDIVRTAKQLLDDMTDEDRLDVFSDYCIHCGDKDPRCQCWNDD